jgi:hypothetical protein
MLPGRLFNSGVRQNNGTGFPRPQEERAPRVFETNQGGKIVRIVSDPNKQCRNCGLRGHDYTTCFRYPEPPTNIQCRNCPGYHAGECKRQIPQNVGKLVKEGQNDRPSYNDKRFPMNQGLGNRGRQAFPAQMAGIQQRNTGRPEGEAKVVYVQVARSDIVDDVSGYNFSGGDFQDRVVEEYNLSQITDEELAQIQEDEGVQYETEDDQGSHITHQYLNED